MKWQLATKLKTITAGVGFVVVKKKYLIVLNERGWDIPGGHCLPGENPEQTFKREVREETGHDVNQISVVTYLENVATPGIGIAVFQGQTTYKHKFAPTLEIRAIKLVTKKELLKTYFGDKKLLGQLLKKTIKTNEI